MALNKKLISLILTASLTLGIVIGVSIKTSQQKPITPNAPTSNPLACNEECPGEDGVLRSCLNGGEQSLCNRAGRVEICGGKNFCCPNVNGSWTNDMTACPTCEAKAPTSMTVENISGTSVKLKWSGASGGTIRLWASKNADPTSNCGTGADCLANDVRLSSTTVEYLLQNLTPNTKYYWRVMTWKQDGCDNGSSVANFTTTNVVCTDTTWTPDVSTVCAGAALTQTSNCGTSRQSTGTKTDGACVVCTDTTWTPDVNTVCTGVALTQTSNCGKIRQVTGTKAETWTPDQSSVCSDATVTQAGSCGGSRTVSGTKNCCVDNTWGPATTSTCSDQKLLQTSNCGNNREVDGTKTCSANLSITTKAYQDDARNKPGVYFIDKQVSKVSRDQFVIYTLEVKNTGEGGAKNVKITDTLNGQNQNMIAFVDTENKCSFDSPSKRLTCEIANIPGKGAEKLKFRVKVAQTATNGKIIKNNGRATYKNKTIDSTVDLLVSSIVACNETCNSDSECIGGLACDVFSNKCRKAICIKDDTCGCLSPTATVTAKPTATTTVSTTITTKLTPTDGEAIDFPESSQVNPTTKDIIAEENTQLPETGVFDFPQTAVFGGGILLAVLGLILAL